MFCTTWFSTNISNLIDECCCNPFLIHKYLSINAQSNLPKNKSYFSLTHSQSMYYMSFSVSLIIENKKNMKKTESPHSLVIIFRYVFTIHEFTLSWLESEASYLIYIHQLTVYMRFQYQQHLWNRIQLFSVRFLSSPVLNSIW